MKKFKATFINGSTMVLTEEEMDKIVKSKKDLVFIRPENGSYGLIINKTNFVSAKPI